MSVCLLGRADARGKAHPKQCCVLSAQTRSGGARVHAWLVCACVSLGVATATRLATRVACAAARLQNLIPEDKTAAMCAALSLLLLL
jgi:hypothetical protein